MKRTCVVLALVVVIAVLGGCSSAHKTSTAAPYVTAVLGNSTGLQQPLPANKYPLAPHDVGVCRVVGVPYRDAMKPKHVTFVELAQDAPLDGRTTSPAAGIFLMQQWNQKVTLGAYGPIVAFTMAKYLAKQKDLPLGKGGPDPKVVASAHQLDAFLANGGCPG